MKLDPTKRPCPICNSRLQAVLFKNTFVIPTVGGFYPGNRIVRCKPCKMIFASGIPSIKEFAEYYDRQDKKSAGFMDTEPIRYQEIHENTVEWLLNRVNADGLADKNILDVGCFTGDMMQKLEERGCHKVFGYDPSVSGIKIAKAKGLNAVCASSFVDSGLPHTKFDLIILNHVLEHIYNPIPFLKDIIKASAPFGTIVVEVPDTSNFYLSKDKKHHIDQREPMLQFGAEHINFFTVESLWRLFDKVGWKLRSADHSKKNLTVIRAFMERQVNEKRGITSYVMASKDVQESNLEKVWDALLYSEEHTAYVWGAGGHSQRLFSDIEGDIPIEAFIDNSPEYAGGTLLGRPIIKPHQIDKTCPIIISSLLYQDEIEAEIKSLNIPNKVVKLYED